MRVGTYGWNWSRFTSKYRLKELLYVDCIEGMGNAIDREKQLKKWHRDWKWNLIKQDNPELADLAKDWFDENTIREYGEAWRDSETSSERP